MSQKFAAYKADPGPITAFYDSEDSPVPEGVSAIEITDIQWQACLENPGWTVAGGQLVAPTPPTAAQIAADAWAAYQVTVRGALDASDTTVLRCFENGVTLPAAWVAYRNSLREIVSAASGDATQALPARPAYPSGT